jgi:RNA polymerase sigma-70 factor (ECF subfamily)
MAAVQYLKTPTNWSDDQLKLAASKSRKIALELLIQKYRQPLFRHAVYILKDKDDAYDVVQETFIRAIRETRIFELDFRIKAWLFRVTKNLCLNNLRNTSRRSAILSANPMQDCQDADQLQEIFAGERRVEMMKSMEKLSEDHQEILILRYYDELSYAEISHVLNVKLGTVMSRLSRARTHLLNVVDSTDE